MLLRISGAKWVSVPSPRAEEEACSEVVAASGIKSCSSIDIALETVLEASVGIMLRVVNSVTIVV